jgi:hypothetical protein
LRNYHPKPARPRRLCSPTRGRLAERALWALLVLHCGRAHAAPMGQAPPLRPTASLTSAQSKRAWPDPGLPFPLERPADLLHFLKLSSTDLGKVQIKPLQGLDRRGRNHPPRERLVVGRHHVPGGGRRAGRLDHLLVRSPIAWPQSLDENFQRFAGPSRRSRRRRFCSCLETLRKNLRMTMPFLGCCSKELTSSNRFLQT